MRWSLRWKLVASYLVVIAILWTVGLAYLQVGLSDQLEDQLVRDLTRDARLARLTLRSPEVMNATNPERAIQAAAKKIGGATGFRVTIIAPEGRVLGDSALTSAEVRRLENHAARPEVVSAKRSGIGKSIRFSATLGRDLLYLALPLEESPVNGGVIRLAMEVSDVEIVAGNIRQLLFFAGGTVFLLALVVSFGAGKIAQRVFHQLNQSVEAISRGEFHHRVRSTRTDEVGEFSRAIDRLLGEVEGRLEDLRRERDRLGAILQGMSEGVMVTDSAGRIQVVNAAFRSIFPSLPLIREDIPTPPEALRAPQVQEAVREALAGSGDVYESEVELSGPPLKKLLLNAAKFGSPERRQLVVVFHDVTHIRQLESVRRDFTTNVSHELKTPLTAIPAGAEALQLPVRPDSDAVQRFSSAITRQCHRLEALVEDLLELGRIESVDDHVRPEMTSLRGAIQAARRVLEPLLKERRVELVVEIPEDAEEVWGDTAALERVHINLLENAVNYSPPDSEIKVSALPVDDGWLEVSIADCGEGIAPEHLPRIFERFYRVDSSRSRDRGGTGLGLAIVKHLIHGMAGEVTAESAPGKGSVFRLRLRRSPPDSGRPVV